MSSRKRIILYISEILSCISLTIIGSFYPAIAASKGIPIWLIGFIVSIAPIMGIPTSLLLGKYMNIIGRKFFLSFGLVLVSFGFILIDFVELLTHESALILSIFSRVLTGIGAACSMTTVPAILISENPDQIDKTITNFEIASGVGLMLGSFVGSVIVIAGIFPSLLVTACIYLIFSIVAFIGLGELKTKETRTGSLSLYKFIRKPVII